MCHISVVVGSKETSSCYNAFQKQLAFSPASLYLPRFFFTAWTSEREDRVGGHVPFSYAFSIS